MNKSAVETNAAGVGFGKKAKLFFQKYPQVGTLAAFFVIVLLFATQSPVFLTGENISNILNQTAPISIVAFGMTMVLIIGGMDLSVSGTLALACMVCAKLLSQNMSPVIAVLCALLLGAFIGLCNGLLITTFNIQPFLITLGMMNITRGFARFSTNGQSVYIEAEGFRKVFSQGQIAGIPVLVFWTAIVLLAAFFIVKCTPFGRRMQAIGGNSTAALNSGVKVNKIKCIVFAINGFLAALAGIIILSRLSSGLPTVGTGIEMDSIAATVLGGTGFAGEGGNMFGTLLGSLVIGTVINGLTIMGVDSYIQEVVKGGIIIVTVVLSVLVAKRNDK